MNIRIASAFLLGLATMALASLSCSAEEPAPTATPAPQASAQDISERACTKMQRTDSYDITSESASYQTIGTASEELYDRWSAKAEFDGSDYHIERSELTGERRQSATIRIGESGYEKSTSQGGVWKEMSRKPGDLNGLLIGLGSDPICPTTADFRDLGTTTLNGEEVKRYTNAPVSGGKVYSVEEVLQKGDATRFTSEFWVNAEGLITQVKGNIWGGYINDDGTPIRYRVTHTTGFLDIGEPNTITAPALGE